MELTEQDFLETYGIKKENMAKRVFARKFSENALKLARSVPLKRKRYSEDLQRSNSIVRSRIAQRNSCDLAVDRKSQLLNEILVQKQKLIEEKISLDKMVIY